MNEINLGSHTPPKVAQKDICFFCGESYAPQQLTREHVFPMWLQKKLDLSDCLLNLLNGTTIPYRMLTVPACVECNGVTLSRIEKKLQKH